jgi:hypothetical protein
MGSTIWNGLYLAADGSPYQEATFDHPAEGGPEEVTIVNVQDADVAADFIDGEYPHESARKEADAIRAGAVLSQPVLDWLFDRRYDDMLEALAMDWR